MLTGILDNISTRLKSEKFSKSFATYYGAYQEQDSLKADFNVFLTFTGITGAMQEVVNLDAPVVIADTLEVMLELLIKDPQNNYNHLNDVYQIFYIMTGFHPPCADNVKRFFVTNLLYSGRQNNGFHLYTLSLSASLVLSRNRQELRDASLFISQSA